MPWILNCRPAARHALRGKAASVAAIVGAGVVAPRPAPAIRQGGPVCRWELVGTADSPLYGGVLPPGFYGTPAFASVAAAPVSATDSGEAVGGLGNSTFGGYGSALDTRDFAALVPLPGASILPAGEALVVLQGRDVPGQPVSVPEPSSIIIFAGALVALAIARRLLNA